MNSSLIDLVGRRDLAGAEKTLAGGTCTQEEIDVAVARAAFHR